MTVQGPEDGHWLLMCRKPCPGEQAQLNAPSASPSPALDVPWSVLPVALEAEGSQIILLPCWSCLPLGVTVTTPRPLSAWQD